MNERKELKKFTALVEELNAEFIKRKGLVTCEFSTSGNFLPQKMTILAEHQFDNEDVGGVWSIFPCDTCKGHNEDKPFHVMLNQTVSQRERKLLYQNSILSSELNKVTKANLEMEDTLEQNMLVPKLDFKQIINDAMDKYNGQSMYDIPETLVVLSEQADNL